MTAQALKPWPHDAVMIVAAFAGDEKRGNMESVVACKCRDCGRDLSADSFTIRRARMIAGPSNRPVLFFCIPCMGGYDSGTIDLLEDHSRRMESGVLQCRPSKGGAP